MNFVQPRKASVALTTTVLAVPSDRSPHRLATSILLIYLFLIVSRGVETISVTLGANLHLTLILMMVSLAAAAFTGGLLDALKTPTVVIYTALTSWFMVTILTSEWRGGSVSTLTTFWIPSYACVLLMPSLISTLDQCRKAYYVLAFSLLPMLLTAVAFQTKLGGRDAAMFGSLGNPNDLAFSLLLLIPFAVFVVKNESRMSGKTILCAIAIVFASVEALKTGSRAALVSIAVCFVILFLSGGARLKIKVIGFGALLLVSALVLLPSEVLRRYATLFNGTSYESEMSTGELSAVESTRARKMLFQESVRLMLEHPLFGVGPGIFSAALAKDQKGRGDLQTWHEAHNSYTQVGSEMGLPAFFLYVSALVYSLKRTISIYRRARSDPDQVVICRMAASLSMALVIFAICAAFGNYSYTFHLPVLAGLAQALDVCARKEMNTTQPALPNVLPARPIALTTNPLPTYVRNRRLRHNRV